ncbi:MAG: hypothetical protein ACLFVG_05795 [Candidatus Aminicenantes bacterium]
MKKSKSIILTGQIVIMIFIISLITISCSKSSEDKTEATQPEISNPETAPTENLQNETFEIELPNSEDTLTVNARIPATWIRNPDFGTVVFQPKDYEDYFYPPFIQFTISCAGSCDPEAIPGNIEKRIKGIIDTLTRPNINTGDPELDAIRANVDILTEEKFSENDWIFAAVVTYPENLSSVQYVPKVAVHAFRHHPGDAFFVETNARAHLDQKDEMLKILMAACKETNY